MPVIHGMAKPEWLLPYILFPEAWVKFTYKLIVTFCSGFVSDAEWDFKLL
jgi:hypothetical protein